MVNHEVERSKALKCLEDNLNGKYALLGKDFLLSDTIFWLTTFGYWANRVHEIRQEKGEEEARHECLACNLKNQMLFIPTVTVCPHCGSRYIYRQY